MMLFHNVLIGFYIRSNEFRELSRHYDVIVEPNHLKFNIYIYIYIYIHIYIQLYSPNVMVAHKHKIKKNMLIITSTADELSGDSSGF